MNQSMMSDQHQCLAPGVASGEYVPGHIAPGHSVPGHSDPASRTSPYIDINPVLGRTGSLTDGTQGKALLAVMSPLFTPTILRYFIVVPKLLTIFEEPLLACYLL